MKWDVIYSEHARQDLRNIYVYIAEDLLSPETASGQVNRIMREIRSLEEMPGRCPVYREEPWHRRGLRFLPADNYLIFFLTDNKSYKIRIVRIMYSGRNIRNMLMRTKDED